MGFRFRLVHRGYMGFRIRGYAGVHRNIRKIPGAKMENQTDNSMEHDMETKTKRWFMGPMVLQSSNN